MSEGRQSEIFQRYPDGIFDPNCCFSIYHGSHRESLDLVSPSGDEARTWVTGLRYLMAGISDEDSLARRQRTRDQYPWSWGADLRGELSTWRVTHLGKGSREGVLGLGSPLLPVHGRGVGWVGAAGPDGPVLVPNSALKWLKQTFDEADKNGDGSLSIGEVLQLLHKLNVNLPRQRVKQMFKVRECGWCPEHRLRGAGTSEGGSPAAAAGSPGGACSRLGGSSPSTLRRHRGGCSNAGHGGSSSWGPSLCWWARHSGQVSGH